MGWIARTLAPCGRDYRQSRMCPTQQMPVFIVPVPPVSAKRAESQLMPAGPFVIFLFCILLLVSR
jgi:hypothetical protein